MLLKGNAWVLGSAYSCPRLNLSLGIIRVGPGHLIRLDFAF